MDTLIQLDLKFLASIRQLDEANTTAWKNIKDHLKACSDELTAQALHQLPDYRLNYAERSATVRGFSMALDTIQNIFHHAEQLLTELRDQEDVEAAKEREEKRDNENTF